MRVIPTRVQTADELGLTREVQNLCYLTKGLVVVTGPTGSGKSTTAMGILRLLPPDQVSAGDFDAWVNPAAISPATQDPKLIPSTETSL